MSTLTVSIVALVVFVVGAVVMFNLWQARGSRQRDRDLDEDRDRNDRSARAHEPQAAFDLRGVQKRDALGAGAGNRWTPVDPGAWARERREPTLLSEDEDHPRAAGTATREAPASALDSGVPQGGALPPGPGLPGVGLSAGGRVPRAAHTHAARHDPRRSDAPAGEGGQAVERLIAHGDALGGAERLPGEDLGPPEFEVPRLDPIPPETTRAERPGSGPPPTAPYPAHVAPTLVDDGSGDAADTSAADDETPQYTPAEVEHAITLVPRAPVNAERLIALTSSLRHVGSKAVRIEIAGGRGEWLPLQSGVMVARLRCSVLLANRQGPLNAVELSDFSDAIESLARRIGSDFVAPDMNQVLRRARELDAVAARLDTQVDLGVESSAPITAQKLASVARKLDLADKGGRFACFAAGGDLLFTLAPGATSDMLALVLDVPRTAEEHDPWRRMVACASSCAKLTGGRVVDNAGRGMSVALIDNVGLQIQKRYRELSEAGLKAGSPGALRVFN